MKNKDKNNLIIALVVILVLLLFGGLGIRSFGSGMMDASDFGFGFFNELLTFLLIVLVIAGIFWLIKNINYNQGGKK